MIIKGLEQALSLSSWKDDSSVKAESFGGSLLPWKNGDTVGCRLDRQKYQAWFTLNGKCIGGVWLHPLNSPTSINLEESDSEDLSKKGIREEKENENENEEAPYSVENDDLPSWWSHKVVPVLLIENEEAVTINMGQTTLRFKPDNCVSWIDAAHCEFDIREVAQVMHPVLKGWKNIRRRHKLWENTSQWQIEQYRSLISASIVEIAETRNALDMPQTESSTIQMILEQSKEATIARDATNSNKPVENPLRFVKKNKVVPSSMIESKTDSEQNKVDLSGENISNTFTKFALELQQSLRKIMVEYIVKDTGSNVLSLYPITPKASIDYTVIKLVEPFRVSLNRAVDALLKVDRQNTTGESLDDQDNTDAENSQETKGSEASKAGNKDNSKDNNDPCTGLKGLRSLIDTAKDEKTCLKHPDFVRLASCMLRILAQTCEKEKLAKFSSLPEQTIRGTIQNELQRLGVVELICQLILRKDLQVVEEAIALGSYILQGGNRLCQEKFLSIMSSDDFNTCRALSTHLRYFVRHLPKSTGKNRTQLLRFIKVVVQFVERLCEGQFAEMQNLLRSNVFGDETANKDEDEVGYNQKIIAEADEHDFEDIELVSIAEPRQEKDADDTHAARGTMTSKKHNFSVVHVIAELFQTIETELEGRHKWCTDLTEKGRLFHAGKQIVQTLAELIQGPCEGNRIAILNVGVFTTVSKYMDIVRYEQHATETEIILLQKDKNKLHTKNELWLYWKHILDFEANMMVLVSSELEGNTEPQVIENMVSNLDARTVVDQFQRHWKVFNFRIEQLNEAEERVNYLIELRKRYRQGRQITQTEFMNLMEDVTRNTVSRIRKILVRQKSSMNQLNATSRWKSMRGQQFEMGPLIKEKVREAKRNLTLLRLYGHQSQSAKIRDYSTDAAFHYYATIETVVESSEEELPNQEEWQKLWEPIVEQEQTEFDKHFGRIELVGPNNELQRVYFPLPKAAKTQAKNVLVEKEKSKILESVKRDNPEEKLDDFAELTSHLRDLIWFQHRVLTESKLRHLVRILSLHEMEWVIVTYILTATINGILLFQSDVENGPDFGWTPEPIAKLVHQLGFAHLALSLLLFLNYLIGTARILIMKGWKIHGIEPVNKWERKIYHFTNRVLPKPLWSAYFVLRDPLAFYHILFVLLSAIGLEFHFFYAFHMLDLALRIRVLRYVIQSVTANIGQVLASLIMAFLIIYIYTGNLAISFPFFFHLLPPPPFY